MKRRRLVSLFGYIGFFLLISVIITVAMFIYVAVDGASGGNRAVLAGVMFAVIVVLALVCTLVDYFRRKLTVERHVDSILGAVTRMSGGDYSVRLTPVHPYDRYDEFDCIMERINILAEELSKVEMFRNDFIANVSHEIKTPLAVISSYAAALASDNLPPQDRSKYTAALSQASKRLTKLVTDILKLNKLENQKITPVCKDVNVGELLRLYVVGIEEKFEEKGLELVCDIDDVVMPADESLLEIVWNNLISNAVKFTPTGGSIYVSLKDSAGAIILTVRDTGCGISAETGERIFDKFYQGDTSHSQEGNGLGLALVKRVVDLVGGEICVRSKPGEGSEFSVKLRKQGEE